MTTAFDTFASSPLDAFLRSALDARKGAAGLVKIIGNALENEPTLSGANDSVYVLAFNNSGTFWTLQISKDIEIVWQRKHVQTGGWTIRGYAATALHTFVVVRKTTTGDGFLFIQSALDGSTTSVNIFNASPFVIPTKIAKTGGDAIVAATTLNQAIGGLGPQVALVATISSVPAASNEFALGKASVTTTFGALFVDGSDVYVNVVDSITVQTVIKTSLAGTIAWQKKVGTTTPPAVAANAASSRVYLATGLDIIALNSTDGSFVWGKRIVKVQQIDTITIEAFDAATTYNVTISGTTRSQVGTTDAATTVTNLATVLNAPGAPFESITWAAVGNTVTGTADSAGIAFSMSTSVTGGAGTISNVTTTPNNTGAAFPLGSYLADDEGIFATYNPAGSGPTTACILIKLDAVDGSELFARGFGFTHSGSENFQPVGFADSGDLLLLAGLAASSTPETFGSDDIIAGACASSQATDYARVYADVTPVLTNGTYSSASTTKWTFTPDTFDNQAGDLSIKDLPIDDFPE